MARETRTLTASQIIRQRRNKVELRDGYISWLLRLIVLIIAGWLLLTQLLLVTQAPDNSMFPAIDAGDLIVAYRLQGEYSKDDVVIYTVDGEQKVGRIVARETDIVNIDENGYLIVNGTTQTGEIVFSTYAKEGITYPFTVPEGCVFILNDYRTTGTDSRDFGAVSLKNVEGKAITILRRRSL